MAKRIKFVIYIKRTSLLTGGFGAISVVHCISGSSKTFLSKVTYIGFDDFGVFWALEFKTQLYSVDCSRTGRLNVF